ncbi:MAG: J domain-containing protein [Ignavibacteria bacterium]|nr:J domain-containing protein [Ignavibacteria bacterium]
MENSSLLGSSNIFNYLESPLLNSFYSVREGYYYYLSLKQVNSRRGFAEKIKNDAIRFIELLNTKELEDFINSIAFSDNAKISFPDTQSETSIEIMKKEDIEGFKLLELSEPISIESLKNCYRAAAKRHHPDKGGSTKHMQKVNNAFEKFHKILCFKNIGEIDSGSDDTSEIKNVNDFLSVLHELIIDITLDNWKIEETYKWILKYLELGSKLSKNKLKQIDLIPTLTSLAEKLYIANFKKEADFCLSKAEKYLIIAKKEGLFFDNFVNDAKEVLIKSGKYRVVVTHLVQAKNLYKYKIINEKRFNDSLRKFNTKEDEENKKEEILKQFIFNTRFLKELPSDKFDDYVFIENKLIEEPGYFNYNFEELNVEQKTEYKKAFSINTTLQLVRKYIYVRLHSLLKSIISFKDLDIIESVIIELEFLKKIKAPRSSVDFDCDQLIELIRYFKSLSNDDLIERINLLLELDIHALELAETKTEYLSFVNPSDVIFRIELNKQYYDIAKLSIDDLKNGLITGKIEETNEVRKKKESWESDLNMIKKVEQKHGDMKLFEILDESKSNPERVIQNLRPYVEDLLNLGKRILNVGELQVMYWVDKLTIAYVRIKDYKTCFELLERIYKLPEEYWDRSSNSEKNGIKKRYEKCLKEIAKV